jgi:hypothetical protein
MRKGASTPAIEDVDLVNAVQMEDPHIYVARDRVRAEQAGVVELDEQA